MDSPSVAIVHVKGRPRTVRDAVIRGRAVVSALDDLLATSARKREDPRAFALRDDVDVPKALKEFERELASLVQSAFVAEMEWENAARGVEAWKKRRSSAEKAGEPLLAQQAFLRQQAESLVATELRLELEEWQQMVADYSAIIDMLKARMVR